MRIAVISNPVSTGNRADGAEFRAHVAKIAAARWIEPGNIAALDQALHELAGAPPEAIAVNGGDGTVQLLLTRLQLLRPFGDAVPPIAVLPRGKTNLVAHDLGNGERDARAAFDRLVRHVEGEPTLVEVERQLIRVDAPALGEPVFGMFAACAGLVENLLFCRHKIYPLGLPNAVSHALTAGLLLLGTLTGARYAPVNVPSVRITPETHAPMDGRFFVALVTTLDRLLLGIDMKQVGDGTGVRLMAIPARRRSIAASARAILARRLPGGGEGQAWVLAARSIELAGPQLRLLLDGELIEARRGDSIRLSATPPMRFLSFRHD